MLVNPKEEIVSQAFLKCGSCLVFILALAQEDDTSSFNPACKALIDWVVSRTRKRPGLEPG